MFKPILFVLIAMISIQTGASIAKGLFPALGAAGTSALRLLFATLVLWLIFKPWQKKLTQDQLRKLVVYGFSLGLMNLLFYFALERIPLGIAVALEFTGPLAVATFTSKRKTDFLWVLLAGIGIYLLLPVSSATQSLDLMGVLFALSAGACWAAYILYGQKAGNSLPGGLAVTWGMTFAALIVLPFGMSSVGLKIFETNFLMMGLIVGILSSALPYSLEMVALRELPTKTFGILMSLEPAIGALAGLIILQEKLTLLQWMAISCVIFSSLGSSLTAKKTS